MSLSMHCINTSQEIKRVFDKKTRDPEITVACLMQKSIERWVSIISGNKIKYGELKGALINFCPESISVLLQGGNNVLHCLDFSLNEEIKKEWCLGTGEDNESILIKNKFDFTLPYWASFSSLPTERKKIHMDNYESLFLGNACFHPSSYLSDVLGSCGVIVGPFVHIAPLASLGVMCTINAHTAIGADVAIGDYCSIGSGVRIGNGARIGEGVKVGDLAYVASGVKIAPWSVINPGQIVRSDIGQWRK